MTTQEIDRVHIFSQYFESGTGIQFAKTQALSGTLQHSPLRSLCWRLFLNVLPQGAEPSKWEQIIVQKRKEYEKLKKEISIDPHQETNEDLLVNNPLSQVEDSPWQTYFQNKEMQHQIHLDVIRTYPEKEFFQENHVKEMMEHILFIFSKVNYNLGYIQGMHEILAPIIYLLFNESIPESELQNHVVFMANDRRYIEHDAYQIFEKIMITMEPLFLKADAIRKNLSSSQNKDPVGDPDNSMSSPIVIKSMRIQNVFIKKADPTLHTYLTDMEIQPQIYALRWLRLIFSREFHLDDVLTLWDAIFAWGNEFELMDQICVAMLLYIRDQLLEMDKNQVLRRLFNYPPVEDVTIFIDRAVTLLDPTHDKRKAPKVETAQVKESAFPPPAEPTSSYSQLPNEPLPRAVEQLRRSKETRVHMAKRLERIIFILQEGVVSDKPIETDTLIVTIAELKQVKDILNGLLDEE